MNRWLLVLLFSTFLWPASSCMAQVEIPCGQCISSQRPPAPESGFWHNPLKPGTGFTLELQRSTLAGAYFGYDPRGQPLWYTFSGPLIRAELGEPFSWSVVTDLYQFAGGACLGCAYLRPNGTTVARLRIEFLQRSLARFRVDEGPWTLMQPLVYGIPAFPEFAPAISFPVPDLEGAWVLVFHDPRAAHTASVATRAYAAHFYGDGDPLDSRNGDFGYIVLEPPSISSDTPVGSFECKGTSDGSPLCKYRALGGFSHDRAAAAKEFFFPLGNISDSRFKGEASDGETVEAFRLDYD